MVDAKEVMQATCWGFASEFDKYLETSYILQIMFIPCALDVAVGRNYTTKMCLVFSPFSFEALIGASDLFSPLTR